MVGCNPCKESCGLCISNCPVQALDWFDREKAKTEFCRILNQNGKVTLVWNSRSAENEFIKENDRLLRKLCPSFRGFSGGGGTEPGQYGDFFKNGCCEYKVFDNDIFLTLEEYIGGEAVSILSDCFPGSYSIPKTFI